MYREQGTIELDERDSGLTLCNFDDGVPVISGSRALETAWTKVGSSSGVWSTPVKDPSLSLTGLRVDGERAVRARL